MNKLINDLDIIFKCAKAIAHQEDDDADEHYEVMKYELRKINKAMDKNKLRFQRLKNCDDCNEEDPEYYTVIDKTWKEAGFINNQGIVCVDCLEKRLGRQIVLKDLIVCPLNKMVIKMMKRK